MLLIDFDDYDTGAAVTACVWCIKIITATTTSARIVGAWTTVTTCWSSISPSTRTT
jgi:hypothetical protein